MKLRDAWVRGRRRLERADLPDAGLESQVLLRAALSIDRTAFFTRLNEAVPPRSAEAFEQILQRRLQGEPLAYLTGRREFYGLDLIVTKDVLIPRQETEHLVDAILQFARNRDPSASPLTAADIGTGSGAISIALGYHLPDATIFATDRSQAALGVAAANIRTHGLDDRIHTRHGHLFDALDGAVDVIASNPPYLSDAEMDNLPPDVRREPAIALHAGADGMDVLRPLIQGAAPYLNPGGLLIVEIDPRRLRAVLDLAQRSFPRADVRSTDDYAGLPRVVTVTLPRL